MARQPADRHSGYRFRDEVLDGEFGIGRSTQLTWDSAPHETHREVVPIGTAKRLHELCRLAAVGAQPVVKGDRESHFAIPCVPARVTQITPRFLDRGFQVVEPLEYAEVVEGGCDRNFLVILRRKRRDGASEVVDAVSVVAVALEGRMLAVRELATSIEDLIDQRMADEVDQIQRP